MWCKWIKEHTGIWGYDKKTIATEDSSVDNKVTTTIEHQPGKTIWDWLQLLAVLAIPLVLGFATFTFNTQQAAQALDQQRETALQSYFDHMSDLLLGNNTGKTAPRLTDAKSGDQISLLATSRTLTVLRGLDSDRKGYLLKFIYESHLVGFLSKPGAHDEIFRLSGADLSGAVLNQIDLGGIDLSGANLNRANLSYDSSLNNASSGGTISYGGFGVEDSTWGGPDNASLTYSTLVGTHLVEANLSGADLSVANLNHADLRGANLNHADLRSADLRSADLKDTNLNGATYNTKTRSETGAQSGNFILPTQWPKGFNPKVAGAICVDC